MQYLARRVMQRIYSSRRHCLLSHTVSSTSNYYQPPTTPGIYDTQLLHLMTNNSSFAMPGGNQPPPKKKWLNKTCSAVSRINVPVRTIVHVIPTTCHSIHLITFAMRLGPRHPLGAAGPFNALVDMVPHRGQSLWIHGSKINHCGPRPSSPAARHAYTP